ncbi:MAG: selenium-dependent molybdenum cofactor biosynthesis protein YqeB [Muricoprocola sp.]
MIKDKLLVVRGAGDIATGTIYRLTKSGFRVLALESEHPSAIRRKVAFSEAVYEGSMQVEGMTAVLIGKNTISEKERWKIIWSEAEAVWKDGKVPILVDPEGISITKFHPDVVIDAILAKRNLGTKKEMAPLTIALGPGFEAGKDVDVVIETMRGHNLGRIIYQGYALPNTGTPGIIAGYGKERVIHAEAEGRIRILSDIGNLVSQGQVIAIVGESEIRATLTGILRGIIRDGYPVTRGFKVADIDPRQSEYVNCFTISDKARCIAGSVLEEVCRSCLS